jgi:hypothetical protein
MKHSLLRCFLAMAPVASLATAQEGAAPFQVNTFTANNQRLPSISADTTGRFVIGWHSMGQDLSDYAVIARAYEANAVPRTGESLANTVGLLGRQYQPAVAAVPDGGFFVAWTEGFTSQDVWIERFDANGNGVLLTEQKVNPPLAPFGDQRHPSLDADQSGNVVVVWESQNGFGSADWTIFAKRFSAAGAPIGGDIQVSQTTSGQQHRPSVAVDPLGNFVVAWEAPGRDGSGYAVLARRFDAAGNPLGDEFLAHQTTVGNQERPWVDRDAQGNFVVTWQGDGPSGTPAGVFARRFNAAGGALTNELRVSTSGLWFSDGFGVFRGPVVALAPDGRFVVVWQSGHEGRWVVYGQRHAADGQKVGAEFRLGAVVAGHQTQPAVTMQPSGGFVAVWAQNEAASGANETCCFDIWARAFPPDGTGGGGDLIFEDGFETGNFGRWSTAATDAGDLAVTPQAALVGGFGLQANVDDTASLFVQDNTPSDEPRYRARFYFDPNGFDPGEARGVFRTRIFIAFEENPTRRLVAIVLRRVSGQYAVMARVRQDDGSLRDTGFVPISNAPHFIEFDWRKASGDQTLDGRFDLWIDDALVSSLTGLDTFANSMDFARMGALSVKGGASGMLLFDAFESRRQTRIGPE